MSTSDKYEFSRVKSPWKRARKRLTMDIRYRISCRPALWPAMIPYEWARSRRKGSREGAYAEEAHPSADFPLVVDGYPGSANSYATKALRNYLPEGTRFGNHFHSPAETLRCLDLGVPVLLTIRHPERAVVSFLRRWDFVRLRSAVRYYLWFYEAMLPKFEQMVVSDFSYTIHQIDGIAEQLRSRFGAPLELRPDAPEGGKLAAPKASPDVKMRSKEELTRMLYDEVPAGEIVRAEELYQRCLNHPGTLKDEERLESRRES